MSTLGDVVSLGNRTMAQELVRMSAKELDRPSTSSGRVIERGLTQVKAAELRTFPTSSARRMGKAEETVVLDPDRPASVNGAPHNASTLA